MSTEAMEFEGTQELSLSEFLKDARARSGMTQKELSARTGINVNTIKQYERENGSQPTVEKAALLAQALNFDPRDLFMEALEPGMLSGANFVPASQTKDSDREALVHIASLVENRGVAARVLPNLVDRAQKEFSMMGMAELLDIAISLEADLSAFPSTEELSTLPVDATDEICEELANSLIVQVIYAETWDDLDVDQLQKVSDELGRVLDDGNDAFDPGKLKGVPELGLMERMGFMRSPEKVLLIETGFRRKLPSYLLSAIKVRSPLSLVLKANEDGEGDQLVITQAKRTN